MTLYGLTRCTNLLFLPIFNDEAIYIRWASIIREDPSNLFISAVDGKTWLFMWLNSLTLEMFDDILLSGRVVSVVCGALTVAGIYFIGEKLYSPGAGYLAGLIYLLLPYSLLHDRLALVDSLLTTLATCLMLTSIHYDLKKVCVLGIVSGAIMGLGFLTKTPFMIFFVFPPLAIFFFSEYRDLRLWKGVILAYGVAILVVLPYLMYTPPKKMPGVDKLFHNDRFIQGIFSTLQNSHFRINLMEYGDNLLTYLTWPLAAVLLISVAQGIREGDRRLGFLALWFVFPSLAILVFAKETYSRYFLFCIPALALMIGNSLHVLFKNMTDRFTGLQRARTLPAFLMTLLLVPSVDLDFKIINAPERAELTERDRWQYIDSEFSGYGIREAVEFFLKESGKNEIRILFSPVWGNPEDALYIYLKDKPGIKMYSAWWTGIMPIIPPNVATLPVYKSNYQSWMLRELDLADLSGNEVFFVARDHAINPEKVLRENPDFKRVGTYKKLSNDYSFSVYRRVKGWQSSSVNPPAFGHPSL